MLAGAAYEDETVAFLRDELDSVSVRFGQPKLEGSVIYARVDAIRKDVVDNECGPLQLLHRLKGPKGQTLDILLEVIAYDLRLAEYAFFSGPFLCICFQALELECFRSVLIIYFSNNHELIHSSSKDETSSHPRCVFLIRARMILPVHLLSFELE